MQQDIRNFLTPAEKPQPSAHVQRMIPRYARKSARRARIRLVFAASAALSAVILAGSAVFWHSQRTAVTLPKELSVQKSSFTLYYPAAADGKIIYPIQSVRQDQGITFIAIKMPGGIVQVSEQAIPPHPPDIEHIVGFKKFDVSFGTAAVGSNAGDTAVVALSGTTLISANGTAPLKSDDLVSVVKQMRPLK